MGRVSDILKQVKEEENFVSTLDGKIKHSHELMVKDDNVTGHGPASEGPEHKHPLIKDGKGITVGLGPAGETDKGDPEHTHGISGLEDEEGIVVGED